MTCSVPHSLFPRSTLSSLPCSLPVFPQAVSLAGSVLFVAVLGWGLVGAALTTVATQYVGALALLYALSVKGKVRGKAGAGAGPAWSRYGSARRHRTWYSAGYQYRYVASRCWRS